VEPTQPAVPGVVAEQGRHAVHDAPVDAERPPRRRRTALLAGGLLVASSPVAVGAGLFVPGFAALGLGALLLLLPPVEARDRRRRRPWRLLRKPAAASGRAAFAVARFGARAARAAGHWGATSGREGAVTAGIAAFHGARAFARTTSAALSRGWTGVRLAAPPVWRALASTAGSLAHEARAASVRAWVRLRPVLRRARAASTAALTRATRTFAELAHSASARLSAYVDSRTGSR
jgi:hypothetical protein